MDTKIVHTTPDGFTFKYELLDSFSFQVVRVIDDYLPPHIEGGIYVLKNDGFLVGQDGTEDPPEPFDTRNEAFDAGRDYA
jgi:hypothetical protein